MKLGYTIINDPIYDAIQIPKGIIQQLVDHPIFQRLRRIGQLGLTHYVYPGATHNRFHHSMGAMHLTQQALSILKSKGVHITDEELEATTIAILLHDLGHGPFSHSLEHHIINLHHEELSYYFMRALNEEFDGRLTLAMSIFDNSYHKRFLHQLVSGQLDMDRMDYLTRDSFFTGVREGRVGYDRLLKTLNVYEDTLVIEFKGIYSVEQFLMARRLMYWQVYLHKNVIGAGEMLIQMMRRARYLCQQGRLDVTIGPTLLFFLERDLGLSEMAAQSHTILDNFYRLDDIDIMLAMKQFSRSKDIVLSILAQGLMERKLFKIDLRNRPIDTSYLDRLAEKLNQQYPNLTKEDQSYLILQGQEANLAYKLGKEEIQILLDDQTTRPISKWQEHSIQPKEVVKYFACYPKFLMD